MSGIYTDLAMELRELHPEAEGITEQTETDGEIKVKRIGIITEEAAKRVGKAVGNYVTLEAEALASRPLELFEAVEKRLAEELNRMIRPGERQSSVLVVGLGNKRVTPDSLGPRVAEQVFVTRHVKRYFPTAFGDAIPAVSAVAPGVLGVTGVETSDIVKGIAERIEPGCIIAIDSLASRRAARISSTIQLSDAGISPGSGVGNRRGDLSRENLGVPVIAIGVPLVVHASTIARDVIGLIAEETGLHSDEDKLKGLAEQVVEKHLDSMIVTPKDVDTIVEDMSKIVANAINLALFGQELEKVRSLLA